LRHLTDGHLDLTRLESGCREAVLRVQRNRAGAVLLRLRGVRLQELKGVGDRIWRVGGAQVVLYHHGVVVDPVDEHVRVAVRDFHCAALDPDVARCAIVRPADLVLVDVLIVHCIWLLRPYGAEPRRPLQDALGPPRRAVVVVVSEDRHAVRLGGADVGVEDPRLACLLVLTHEHA